MNIFALSGLFITITSAVLGVLTLSKSSKKIHWQWILVCFAVSIWGFGSYKIGIINNPEAALLWWRISYIGVIFIPVLYTHFLITFLGLERKFLLFILYIISFFFLSLNIFSNYFISQVALVFNQFYYINSPTIFYNLFVIIFFSLVLYQIYLLLCAYNKKKRGRAQNQIKYFLIISFIGYGGGVFAFLPVYGLNIYPVLNITIAAFPIIIAYAIFKYQLLDIQIIIQRGAIYSVLLSIIVGFYIVLVFILGLFLGQAADMTVLLAAGITTVLGIFGVPPIERLFRHWTDKIFFKDKYDYSQAIYQLSEILNKNIELEILLKSSAEKLKEILKIKKAFFILPEAKLIFDGAEKLEEFAEKLAPVWTEAMASGELPILDYDQIVSFLAEKNLSSHKREVLKEAKKFYQKHNLAILAPIILEKKLIGLLGLSEKKSGDMFSRDDFNLLKTFSYQAAVAIEKAQLYEQVKSYSEELEKKVRQRTAKIKGLQEEQKQMMLEIAHGLQTPLTIIKAELNFLAEAVADKSKIKSLERTIDRTSKFIYDMLRLAKLESGAQGLKREKVNLSQLLVDLTEEFKIITEERGIEIISRIEPDLNIIGDANSLEEMITNLVSNSVKYIKENGEKKIFIYLKKKNNEAEIIIQDTGIGIKKEDLARLFERFYRARDEQGSVKRGTGLGLAISKRIIEMHNGRIKVESEIRKGTKFIINIPIV